MASVDSSTPLPDLNGSNTSSGPVIVIDPDYGQPAQKGIGIVTFVIVAVGIVANSAVIYVVLRHRDMHTTTNFAFANLALTDILLLIFQALSSTLDAFGVSVSVYLNCWPTFYFRYVVGEATALTLAMMSYDRWRLVAYPLEAVKHAQRRKLAFLFGVLMVWTASLVMYTPVIIYSIKARNDSKLPYSFIFCTLYFPWEHGQKLFQTLTVTCTYIIPLVFISVCYLKIWLKLRGKKPGQDGAGINSSSRRMRRTLRLILIVIVVFALSWLPYRILIVWVVWDPSFLANSSVFLICSAISSLIIYLNSVINPFIYPFAGTGFRKHIRCLRTREQTLTSRTTKMSAVAAPSSVKNTNVMSLSVSCQTAPQL